MKKAAKRLEPLLNLHRLRRGILKQLLAALRLRHADESARIVEWSSERERVREWNRARLVEGGDASHGRLAEDWSRAAERRRAELIARLADLARQIEDADGRLVKVSQELKMLSTLRDRRVARERELEAKHEQRELDEMASHCAGRP